MRGCEWINETGGVGLVAVGREDEMGKGREGEGREDALASGQLTALGRAGQPHLVAWSVD